MENEFNQKLIGLAESHKCLSCGSNLKYDIVQKALQCSYCGKSYEPVIFEIADSFPGDVGRAKASDINGQIANSKNDSMGQEIDAYWRQYLEGQREVICDSCGARIMSGANTLATTCVCCGSPAIISQRITDEYKPDYIIPFTFTRRRVADKVNYWLDGFYDLPSDFYKKRFRKTMGEKLQPVYVPFWLIDSECYMDVEGIGTNLVGETDMDYYRVTRRGKYSMGRVPFDGSSKMDDKLVEAIEPFNYEDMVPFNPSYLDGFNAECYELNPLDMAERISGRFGEYLTELANDALKSKPYDSMEIRSDSSRAEDYVSHYALFPVWTLNFTCKNQKVNLMVNGQTGEVAGYVPHIQKQESKLKKVLTNKWFIVMLVVAVILALLGIEYAAGFAGPVLSFLLRLFTSVVPFLLFGVVTAAMVAVPLLKISKQLTNERDKTMRHSVAVDKKPGAKHYVTKFWPEFYKSEDVKI